MKQSIVAFLQSVIGYKRNHVPIVSNDIQILFDAKLIPKEKWTKRITAAQFMGHKSATLEHAAVGDSLVIKCPVTGKFLAVTVDEFEVTAFMYLSQKGYSVRPPVKRRESDRY
jgi:hypothetical protein